MKEYIKHCTICNKEFSAKRRHAETCSEACRAEKNAKIRAEKMIAPAIELAKGGIIEAAKPLIIEEARAQFIDEYKDHDYCECCGKYKKVSAAFSKHFPLPIQLCENCTTYEKIDSMGRYRAKAFIEADYIRVSNGGRLFSDMMKDYKKNG